MNQSAANSPAPVVWLLQDKKPGHINQLRGLGNRLKALARADVRAIDATQTAVPLWRAILGLAPVFDSPEKQPDLIIASGHDTHRLLLALRRTKGAKTVILMKPGFPLGCVDAVIAPEHDGLKSRTSQVFSTEGVINAVTPMAKITDKPEVLILVGGPSDHFQWDDDALLGQITGLMDHYSNWRWTISSSRRTPGSTRERLQNLEGAKVAVVDDSRTHSGWLTQQFAASRAVWVTPDSGSMVCEAITSGVPTGVFELPAMPKSQIAGSVSRFLQKGYAASWSDHATVMTSQVSGAPLLWEADRAARWLIKTHLKGTDTIQTL